MKSIYPLYQSPCASAHVRYIRHDSSTLTQIAPKLFKHFLLLPTPSIISHSRSVAVRHPFSSSSPPVRSTVVMSSSPSPTAAMKTHSASSIGVPFFASSCKPENVVEMSPRHVGLPRTPSIEALIRIIPSGSVGTEDDVTTGLPFQIAFRPCRSRRSTNVSRHDSFGSRGARAPTSPGLHSTCSTK